MKNKILIAFLTSIFLLTGCGIDITGSWYQTHYIVDDSTGVNYLFVNSDSGVAISPRYNNDGSLYISEVE